jgi:succinate dehydrogenase/fumarate reductase iron-sulfur protein
MVKKSFKPGTYTMKILRFDPTVNSEPYFQEYRVPISLGTSVTNVLDYIYDNLDSSIAYYTNCHKSICGRCILMVNGRRRLACTELVTGDSVLKPLPDHKVVRDLVVEGI